MYEINDITYYYGYQYSHCQFRVFKFHNYITCSYERYALTKYDKHMQCLLELYKYYPDYSGEWHDIIEYHILPKYIYILIYK